MLVVGLAKGLYLLKEKEMSTGWDNIVNLLVIECFIIGFNSYITEYSSSSLSFSQCIDISTEYKAARGLSIFFLSDFFAFIEQSFKEE